VMGANSFGDPPPNVFGKYLRQPEVNEAIKICKSKGVTEFDTARLYTGGNSEITLGKAVKEVFTSSSAIIATKAHPNMGFTGKDIEKQLDDSLKALNMKCVDIFYLHAPDTKVPLEDSLSAVNRLHKQGKFKEFGLSNYLPFQVAQIYFLCKMNGWILPTIYQGIYNLISRNAERELFLVLRQLKIKFYAFSPLAGGLLVQKRKFEEKPESGRFSRTTYFDAYWHKQIFEEIEIFSNLCKKYGLEMRDAAMRWIMYHGELNGECGDAVILGASSVDQVRDNLDITLKGTPLDEEFVKEIDNMWIRLGKGAANLEGGQWRMVQPISSL